VGWEHQEPKRKVLTGGTKHGGRVTRVKDKTGNWEERQISYRERGQETKTTQLGKGQRKERVG